MGRKIKGINNFKKFYLNQRRLLGKHKLISVLSFDDVVVVRGDFLGNQNFSFADFFYFKKGLINKRYTYVGKGNL